jgi:hypothetical protein
MIKSTHRYEKGETTNMVLPEFKYVAAESLEEA